MRTKLIGLGLYLAANVGITAADAQVTTNPYGQQDGWKLEAEFENGRFQGCFAAHTQSGIQRGYGSTLRLGQTFANSGKLFILATDYNLPSPSFNTKVQLGFKFFNTEFRMSPPWAGFVLNPKMLKAMKTASFIDLRLGPAGPSFNVWAPNNVLKKLDQCVTQYQAKAGQQATRHTFPNQNFQTQQFKPTQRQFGAQQPFQPQTFRQQPSKVQPFKPQAFNQQPFKAQPFKQQQFQAQPFKPKQQFGTQNSFQPQQRFQPQQQGKIASTYSSPLPPVQGSWRWLNGQGNSNNFSTLKYLGGSNLQYCYNKVCRTAAFKMIDGATIEFSTDRQNRFRMQRLPNNIVTGKFWLNSRNRGGPDAEVTMRP